MGIRPLYRVIRDVIRDALVYFGIRQFRYVYPKNNFIILAEWRTGSTLLTTLLNCHPDIVCEGEIFHEVAFPKILFPYMHIKACSKYATVIKKGIYGFKVKMWQLYYCHKISNYKGLLHKLHKEGWKFIFLKRADILRQALSSYRVSLDKVFERTTKEGIEKMKVDCKKILEIMMLQEDFFRRTEEALNSIPHLSLTYEDDLMDSANHQKTADKVFAYIGARSFPVKTDLVKIAPHRIADDVINYAELCLALKGTPYAKYLEG